MSVDRHYKVIISDRAKRMLASHIHFIAQVNRDVAKAKKKERFPFFNETYIIPNKYRKMFIQKWYIVLYQIKDDTVYVDYIIDCRKNYAWLMN